MGSLIRTLVRLAIALASILIAVPPMAQWSGHGTYPSTTTHERFATFMAGSNFNTTLILENLRPDQPITVTPSLILASGDVAMSAVTLPPHSTQSIDIGAFLAASGYPDTQGIVSIQYKFSSYGALTALVQSEDEVHWLYFNSVAASPEEYWSGTAFDAVIWAPDEGTKGFVSIINTSSNAREVDASFIVDGRTQVLAPIQVPAWQSYTLPIDSLIPKSRENGASIHVAFNGKPGDILVEGEIYNRRTGFVKNIHFADKALHYSTATLRAGFVLLGNQPPEDGYPAGISFRSVAAVHNMDATPLRVTPVLKFLESGTTKSLNLAPLELGPGESRLINLSKEQEEGRLPGDLHQASLALVPANNKGDLVAELFDFDAVTGGYVVGPTFTSYPIRDTTSIWRTDGSFQTTFMVENTADQPDVVSLNLYSGGGSYGGAKPYSDSGSYIKTFPIAAGGLLKINVKQLQEDAIPDDHGRLLEGTSGVMSLIGSNHSASRLAFGEVIHSASEADYVGYLGSPCDYVTAIDLYINTVGGENPFPIMQAWYWSQTGEDDQPGVQTTSSDTSIAQISNNGSGDMVTFTPPDNGQSYQVTLSEPDQIGTICDACSAGDIPTENVTVSTPTVSFSNISGVAVGQTAATTATVDPSNNTIPISLTISGPAAIISPTGTFTTTTTVTVKGLSTGTATLTAGIAGPEGGSAAVGSTSFTVYTPVPSKLVPFNTSCAPSGQGPLQVITNGSVIDCGGVTRATNFCGVNRNLTYQLVDQTGAPFASAYTLSESFSNLSTTNPALGLPTPAQNVPIPAGGYVTDAQFVGFTYPTCLGSNDHHSYTQNFSVVVNGVNYNLSTTVSISDGKFNGTAEDNVSITVR